MSGQTKLSAAEAQDERLGQDVQEFDGWLVELENGAHRGIGEVELGQEHLELKITQFQAKMEEGEGHRQKLLEIVANCEEMKQLPPLSKATVFMRKNLMQTFTELKQQVKKADGFANGVISTVTVQQVVKDDQVLDLLINPYLHFLFFFNKRRKHYFFIILHT